MMRKDKGRLERWGRCAVVAGAFTFAVAWIGLSIAIFKAIGG